MADQVLRGSAQARLTEAFDRVEQEETTEGVHERFAAMADELARQAAPNHGGGTGS